MKQRERLREHLVRYGRVSDSWAEQQALGIKRIPARIHELRRSGLDIRTIQRQPYAVYEYVPPRQPTLGL